MQSINQVILNTIKGLFDRYKEDFSADKTYIGSVVKVLGKKKYLIRYDDADREFKTKNDVVLTTGDIVHIVYPLGKETNKYMIEDMASEGKSVSGVKTVDGQTGDVVLNNTYASISELIKVTDLYHDLDQAVETADTNASKALGLANDAKNLAVTALDKIDNLEFDEITVDYLQANYATLQSLSVVEGYTQKLEGDFISFKSSEFDDLKANYGDISTLMFGTASGGTITTLFANSVVSLTGNSIIKDAMIDTLSVSKILAGDISTNKFRIVSDNGNMLLSDNTIKISDGSRARVQIGKDASSDYNMYVWDKSGRLMFDALGITAAGISRPIIRDDMVSDNANIDAAKINIDSLFSEINGSTKTLKASKIKLDTEAQTLDVTFTNLKTKTNGMSEDIASQGSTLSVIQGKIDSKVWQQDINVTEGKMNTQYSTLTQTVDGIRGEVSNVKTFYDNFEIGGRNLLKSTTVYLNGSDYPTKTTRTSGKITVLSSGNFNAYGWYQDYLTDTIENLSSEMGQEYTLSMDVKTTNFKSGKTLKIGTDFRLSSSADRGNTYIQENKNGIWQRVSCTFKITKNTHTKMLIVISNDDTTVDLSGVVVEYRNFKFEKGNQATDYTPAPEDVQAQIDDTTTKYNQLAEKFLWVVTSGTSQSNMTLSSKVFELVVNEINLSGKVKFEALDSTTKTKINTATTNASTALANAATAQSAASGAQSTLNAWTYTNTTEINGAKIRTGTITADQLSAKAVTAAKIDVNNLFAQTITASGSLQSSNYAYTSGNYSTGGLKLNMSTGQIISKSFAIDASGNAYFAGNLAAPSGIIGGFTIGTAAIHKGTASKTSTIAGIYLGTDAIRAYSNANAYTHIENGILTCSGAVIDGALTSTNGNNATYISGGFIRNTGMNTSNSIDELNISSGGIYIQGVRGKTQIGTGGFAVFTRNNEYSFLVENIGTILTNMSAMFTGTVAIGSTYTEYALSAKSFICESWVRTVGSTGWYNETHGGGWYMTDKEWIRSFNSKSVYISASLKVGAEITTSSITNSGALRIGSTGNNTTISNSVCEVVLASTQWRAAAAYAGGITLGSSSTKWGQIYSTVSTISTSDRNQKKNIEYMGESEKTEKYEQLFMKLNPCIYMFNKPSSDRVHSGFISQDVETTLNEVGLTPLDLAAFCKDEKVEMSTDADGSETEIVIPGEFEYSLRYEEFIALNTHMIQKTIHRVDSHEARINELESEVTSLQNKLSTLIA